MSMSVHYHTGLPVCELGKTGRPITRGKTRTSGTTRGPGGSRGRKRMIKRKHWLASESDSDWEPGWKYRPPIRQVSGTSAV